MVTTKAWRPTKATVRSLIKTRNLLREETVQLVPLDGSKPSARLRAWGGPGSEDDRRGIGRAPGGAGSVSRWLRRWKGRDGWTGPLG